MTLSVAVFDEPRPVAAIVEDVLLDTGIVVTTKVPVVAPGATVTLDGTLAAVVLLDVSVNISPLEGAGALIVTVPVELAVPPFTLVGERLSFENVGVFTPSIPDLVALPAVPDTVTLMVAETGTVGTAKLAVVAPRGNVKVVGTVATDGVEFVSVTT